MVVVGGLIPRKTLGVFAAAGVLLALFWASLAFAASEGEQPSRIDSDLSSAPATEAAKEIPAKRTANSRTFALPDGSREARIFQSPVNYRDGDGDWKPIDTDLQEAADGDGITNAANGFDLSLPDSMGEGSVRLSEGEQWVSYRLLGKTADLAGVKGDKANYELASGAASFELTSIATGVKEEIVLNNLSAPSTYAFQLEAADGLSPVLAEDGSVGIKDKDGKVFAFLPAPTIADSADSSAPTPKVVSYSLSALGDRTWELNVVVDRNWLEDPKRVWPVRIDPTVTISNSNMDCTIQSLPAPNGIQECGNKGAAALLSAYSQKEAKAVRTLVSFPAVGVVPAGASIYDATISLFSPKEAENTQALEMYGLTKWWYYNSVDWDSAAGTWLWTTPGGDYDPASKAEVKTSVRGSAPGWWDFHSDGLTEQVTKWNSEISWGVVIKQSIENKSECEANSTKCNRRYVEFQSSSSTPAEKRPKLVINYWNAAPESSKVISPTDGTRTAKRLKLQATWANGVTGVTWQYREGKSGLFRTIPTELVRDGSGKPVTKWPVAAPESKTSLPLYLDAAQLSPALRKKGGPVQIRALFEGGVPAVSAPVEAKLDPALGCPKDANAAVGPGSVDLLTGNLTVTKTDVSIPTFNSSLDFSRTFSSRDAGNPGNTGVLGQGWKPGVPVEQNGAGEWRSVKFTTETEVVEGVSFSFSYAMVTGIDGTELPFELEGANTFKTPDELTGWSLTKPQASEFVLSTPDGTRTTFTNGASAPNDYLPAMVSQTGGAANSTRMDYAVDEKGNRRLWMIIAPTMPGINCTTNPHIVQGCKVLSFHYKSATSWGAPASYGERLYGVWYWAAGFGGGVWQVAEYGYDANGRLKEVWDPRISPPLKETYTYNATGQIATITPPGLKPWSMEYETLNEEEVPGRLKAVKRDSLVPSDPVAQTTIAYGVPLSGSGAPYPMTGTDVAEWGQTDVPVDATAVFPPDQVPSASPPSSYSRASIYYMDPDGYAVNTATPKGGGTGQPSISTSETDKYGNVVRELTPQNRLRALNATGETAKRSKELATIRIYEDEGTEMAEEIGPLHDVRLEGSGEVVPARSYTNVFYDQVPAGVTLPTPAPHLPTTEITAALVEGELKDKRTNKTEYDWDLRKPTKTIIDSEGLKIASSMVYDKPTGLLVAKRQPSTESGGPGTTIFHYYNPAGSGVCASAVSYAYAGLPCMTLPAQQITGPNPKIAEKTVIAYNQFGQPVETIERPGGEGATRKTLSTYDNAGRPTSQKVEGGGATVPMTETIYDELTGAPTRQQFACPSNCDPGATYNSSFGTKGTANGQLEAPADVATDAAGNVWVLDRANNRVQKFGPAGEYLTQFGSKGSGNGQFSSPVALAIDGAGNIWVVDQGNFRVQKFSSSGQYLSQFGEYGVGNGQFFGVRAIALGGDGSIWVADIFRVQRFTQAGAFIERVGAANGIADPQSLATDPAGNVAVADAGNDRIQIFDKEGDYLRQFGTSGTGPGQFGFAAEVEVDSEGNFWVGDSQLNRVELLDPTGDYLAQFGAKGTGAGQFEFDAMLGIAVEDNGRVWIGDAGNNRVQRWNAITGVYDRQAVTTTYDALGRPVSYKDADGNKSTVTYDLLGRPVTTYDGKGTQTRTYDPTSGLLTELKDSAAGTFTASYDADGNMVAEGLPNGLVAESTYDEAGQLTGFTYDKAGSAWLDFDAERSINGQILWQKSLTSRQEYSYDKAGRLVRTEDWDAPVGGNCTTREYVFGEPGYEELAGKNSNRTKMFTRSPGVGGACATTGGIEQKYKYDAADRLVNEGVVYDDFGRATSLPAALAGGKALTTSYFSTDMVANQTQDGVTNTFQLDAALRQRQRTQGGGLEGVEVFHYGGGSDTPVWTQLGSKWSRNIPGIGGAIAAIQDSGSGTLLQLTNLHGDVVGTATLSTSATKPVATFEYDEFGNPKQAGTPQFGWLGGQGRRTDFASGVIQMGVRSYVPAIGRFISVDPVMGGSANSYDYTNADPVNGLDLTGEWPAKKYLKVLRRAHREARARGYKEFHSICVGKAGCYVTQNGGGSGFSLTDVLSKVVKAATNRLTNPVESYGILGDAMMNAARPIINELTGGEKSRARRCMRALVGGVEEAGAVLGAAETLDRKARLAAGAYAAGKCVQEIR